MTDDELIKNYTLFHAYFCHLIENRQADAVEDLCTISFKLDQEVSKRKISEFEIDNCVKNINFEPEDQLMISKYIYPEMEPLTNEIAQT